MRIIRYVCSLWCSMTRDVDSCDIRVICWRGHIKHSRANTSLHVACCAAVVDVRRRRLAALVLMALLMLLCTTMMMSMIIGDVTHRALMLMRLHCVLIWY